MHVGRCQKRLAGVIEGLKNPKLTVTVVPSSRAPDMKPELASASEVTI